MMHRVRRWALLLVLSVLGACQPPTGDTVGGSSSSGSGSGSGSAATDVVPTGGDSETAATTGVVPNVCGDGLVGDAEACDDGNAIDDDLCSNDCVRARYVFVSSSTHTGHLKVSMVPGIYESDKICQALANGSELLAGRTFRAWLSEDGGVHHPKEWLLDLEFLGWYIRTDGLGVVKATPPDPPTWEDPIPDLFTYMWQLERPIDRDEHGLQVAAPCEVWTNSRANGTVLGPGDELNCANWSTDDQAFASFPGRCDLTDSQWSSINDDPAQRTCDRALHLYCFEVEPVDGCLLDDECPRGQACNGKGSCVPIPPPATQLPPCAPESATVTEWNLALAPDWLTLVDVDDDDVLDVVASEPGAAQLEVARGDGLGGFSPTATIPLGAPVEALGLAAGDLDGDGDPDLAVARHGHPGDVVVLLNEGGVFTASPPLASGSGPPTVYIVDFDADAAPDIVIRHGGFINVHFGDGAGGFEALHETMNLPFFDERPFIRDITADGFPDVVGIRGSGQLSQWQNVGGVLLDTLAVYDADWTMEAALIADLLGQQSDDYVALHAEPDGTAGVALVWTAGALPYSEYLTKSPLHGGWLGPFDADEFPDLVAATHAHTVAVLHSDGAGGFACEQVLDVLDPSYPATLAVGDVDGDGRLDIVAGTRDAPRVAVLRLP